MIKTTAMRELHSAIAPVVTKKYTSKNLSEEDVLALCDLFLTPGIHYVTCATLNDGRRIMKLFIEQLSCYRTIGYIDHAQTVHYEHGLNLYDLFTQHRNNSSEVGKILDMYLLNFFEYDFLGIVLSRSGYAKTFTQLFIDRLINFSFDQRIPIVCVGTQLAIE